MGNKIKGQVIGEHVITYVFTPYEYKKGGIIKLTIGVNNLVYQTELKYVPNFTYENLYEIILNIEKKETNSRMWLQAESEQQ